MTLSKEAIEALESARAHILDAYRIWQADDVSAVPPPKSGAGSVIAKIDAVLSFPIAGEGKVKALIWNRENPYYTARTGFGHYSIERVDSPIPYFELKGSSIWPARKFWKFAEAKAFAQTDYENRILSALISSPGKDGGQEVEELRREIASLEYRLEEANGHLRRLEKSAEPTAWGEVRRGSDGNLAIFSTKFNTVKARFTSGNDLKPGEKVYVGTQPASTALVEALRAAAEELDRISCVPPVTETKNLRDQFDLAKAYADRGAVAAHAALSASQSTSREGER